MRGALRLVRAGPVDLPSGWVCGGLCSWHLFATPGQVLRLGVTTGLCYLEVQPNPSHCTGQWPCPHAAGSQACSTCRLEVQQQTRQCCSSGTAWGWAGVWRGPTRGRSHPSLPSWQRLALGPIASATAAELAQAAHRLCRVLWCFCDSPGSCCRAQELGCEGGALRRSTEHTCTPAAVLGSGGASGSSEARPLVQLRVPVRVCCLLCVGVPGGVEGSACWRGRCCPGQVLG
jgi:hypothetical protein